MLTKLIQKSRRNARKGFTLIELLVVVLILAILMAVALPLYLNAVSDAQLKTCRANMQTIANAEQAYKLRSATHVYAAIAAGGDMVAAGLTDLGGTPTCPSGGKYSVTFDGSQKAGTGAATTAGQLVVTCSIATHGNFAPGIDGQ